MRKGPISLQGTGPFCFRFIGPGSERSRTAGGHRSKGIGNDPGTGKGLFSNTPFDRLAMEMLPQVIAITRFRVRLTILLLPIRGWVPRALLRDENLLFPDRFKRDQDDLVGRVRRFEGPRIGPRLVLAP